ncbi:HNH endonuclease [Microbacterium indicum]|uniref:HNH endonuclease n=1 Tax=Microbacterium indicum TaxID=358100 RepID=UPI0004265A56|nr:HNH endonuclease signature motif containing protein [Microbacterium indicum]
MTTTRDLLDQATGLFGDARAQADAASMSGEELTSVLYAVGRARKALDALGSVIAAEVDGRSSRGAGRESLARRRGFANPNAFISTVGGTTPREAATLVEVGRATAPRTDLSGDPQPARHPHVAAALADGALTAEQARSIIDLLGAHERDVPPDRLERAERDLAARIPGLTSRDARRLLTETEAALRPESVAERHERNRAARALAIRQDADGMTRIDARLDAETAAPIITLLEAEVTRVIRSNEHQDDDLLRDERTPGQIRADALATFAAHALGCDAVPTKPTTTLVVRMTLDQLLDGANLTGEELISTGQTVVRIDGVEAPLPVGALRRLAADAEAIPQVLGRSSATIDLGRRERLFTRSQKLALVQRDGGCAFCGAPPGRTVVHHIRWWSHGGSTDLANGVLLCTACHHRVHDDGWRIDVEAGDRVWFTPPEWWSGDRSSRPAARDRVRPAA